MAFVVSIPTKVAHARTFHRLFVISGLLLLAHTAYRSGKANDPWPGLVQDIFNNRPMNDGGDVIGIEMPVRAEDAAIVPVTLRTELSADDSRQVLSITLVIDQNPAPMAAKFQLGPDAKVSEISTRVRVNNYTDVHAVAELSDGKLYMVKTLCEGVRRLLGACRQDRRRCQVAGWARCATGSSQRRAKVPPAAPARPRS